MDHFDPETLEGKSQSQHGSQEDLNDVTAGTGIEISPGVGRQDEKSKKDKT